MKIPDSKVCGANMGPICDRQNPGGASVGPMNVAIWASYQIRKIAGCACAGNAGNVFPCRRFLRKPLVSDPGMHHGTCVTHVPWCMSGSLTCGDRENVPGIPGACAPAILRIWQEAHGMMTSTLNKTLSNLTMKIIVFWLQCDWNVSRGWNWRWINHHWYK